jgi:Chaperone of endosialidase
MKQMMKQITLFMSLLLFVGTAMAQVPQKFNYQGIARDAQGNAMAKQKLALKLTVLPTADATVAEYEETQLVTTNEFGLYTLQIGNGTAVTGEMKTVKWETGNKYIKVAIDPTGGTNYVDAGTTQLLSVPYAIYADKAGIARESINGSSSGGNTRATNNFIEKTNGSGVVNSNSQLFDNGTNIGLNTIVPFAKLHISGSTGNSTELRLQHSAATGSSRFAFFADNGTAFTTTGDYAVMNKYTAGTAGTLTPGFPLKSLYAFSNSKGGLFFTSAANVGFGQWSAATNTYSTRLFIDSATGRVGIGNVTPATTLDVSGQIRLSGGSPGAGKVLTSDATGIGSWTTPSITSVGGTTNFIPKYTPNGSTLGNSQIFDNGTSVGIGTNIPVAKFQINAPIASGPANGVATVYSNAGTGSESAAISVKSNNTGAPGAPFEYSKALLAGYQTSPVGLVNLGVWGHQNGNGSGGFGGLFSNGTDMTTATKYVGLAGSGNTVGTFMGGNVGIGTTTPNAKLQFDNSISNRKIVLWENANNEHQFYGFGINGSTLRYQIPNDIDAHVFYSATSTTTSNELMRVTGNGNVAIGTSTPDTRLHVSGGNPSIQIEETGSSNSNLIFTRAGDRKWYLLQNFGTPVDNIAFYDNSTGTKNFQLNQGGHIGIGPNVTNVLASSAAMVNIDNAPVAEAALHVGPYSGGLAYTTINRPSTSTTAGILRMRDNGSTMAFFDISSATNQLTVFGNALASGGTWTNSDARIKKDITTIGSALSDIKKLRPTTYYFKSDDEKYKYLNLPKNLQFGLIAQEVREVFPNIVNETKMKDEDGKEREESVLSMNYTELVPVLIKGMQEQQELIEKLEKRINELEKK